MDKDKLGALIDGIYAIAMTILVLELPIPDSGEELRQSIKHISSAIVDYGLTFILLFAFWLNQRRINELITTHIRTTLWLNGLALMMVCLLPFSASLIYKFGREFSSLFEFNKSVLVDLFFVGICLSVDLFIHMILSIIHRHSEDYEKVKLIIRSRKISTVAVILVMFLTFALPGPNRRALIIIPLVAIFEDEIVKFWSSLFQHPISEEN